MDFSVKVLDRHEIFGDALEEVVIQEFESDSESLLARFLKVLSAIADCSFHDFILLWVGWLQAAIGSHNSVQDAGNVFNSLSSMRTH